MSPVRLAAVALVAALPLAGCGNKGPLILNPEPQEMPPQMAASMAPPSAASVGAAPARDDDRTAGRHRWDARNPALTPSR